MGKVDVHSDLGMGGIEKIYFLRSIEVCCFAYLDDLVKTDRSPKETR